MCGYARDGCCNWGIARRNAQHVATHSSRMQPSCALGCCVLEGRTAPLAASGAWIEARASQKTDADDLYRPRQRARNVAFAHMRSRHLRHSLMGGKNVSARKVERFLSHEDAGGC